MSQDQGRSNLKRPRAEAFLDTLRRSSEMAQELLGQNGEMSRQIHSLEDELVNAKARITFLERETDQLRRSLARGKVISESHTFEQLRQLAEEQNCLAHLYVVSDRLSMVQSVEEAVRAAEEVLHNLVGAREYGLWLRWRDATEPQLVKQSSASFADKAAEFKPLIEECFRCADLVRPAGIDDDAVPVCLPLVLGDEEVVGALVVAQLVPQVGRTERLQRDLLSLLSERLAPSIMVADLHERMQRRGLWSELEGKLAAQGS